MPELAVAYGNLLSCSTITNQKTIVFTLQRRETNDQPSPNLRRFDTS